MDKSRSEIVSFLFQVFPLYFPAGESALAKRCRDWKRLESEEEKKNVCEEIKKIILTNYSKTDSKIASIRCKNNKGLKHYIFYGLGNAFMK